MGAANAFVTLALRKENQLVVWISNNNNHSSWDAYQFVLASGTLAACSSETYLPVSYKQYYNSPNETTTVSGDHIVPVVKWFNGEAVIIAANSFALPIPKMSTTIVTLDIVDGTAPATNTATFTCESDTSVLQKDDQGAPSDTTLKMNKKGNWQAMSLVKFATTGITGTVTSATLHVRVGALDIDELMVEAISSGWDASTIVWSTKPARGEVALSAVSLASNNTWITFDVTQGVSTGVSTHSFQLYTSVKTDANVYSELYSSESSYVPYLVVTSLVEDPEPHGVCASPPASPPPTPDWDAHYAMDACPSKGDSWNGGYYAMESNTKLEVACCKLDGSACKVNVNSVCFGNATWTAANDTCTANGYRLCTYSELSSDLCCDVGCSINHELVWSIHNMEQMYFPPSPPSPPPNPPPPPVPYCQLATTGTNAKCNDYTSQSNYATQDEALAAARAGNYIGYAYSSEQARQPSPPLVHLCVCVCLQGDWQSTPTFMGY
ncbi:hypothetical protein CYMTET_27026 [Cymbomonas tetramitiformis]|uniref:Carbohydrate-binding module family 96 domain-containing protein n=1 Tax=Cymbomonas tetramitiformis TaxID=36881 RepID=A0AAE0KXC4_9CHLO|nr:hypothetical protein CYMTET_27026 [Cymbomonas tetramitiformis]